ncbi:MAG: hypothetical protein HN352_02485 [Bacteroidetes bacterium]|nr:hypothetical protein [Bacteroidota bacterium]MBT3751337.1 hypothetical protein [Bacteroidota bacterium]MBT4400136.1 hypothetical protein [Bacteroidota bacterium]MBT4411188.1 hypothetical protein [Bacteroidota bacterium]MBT7091707.1 hypothetical protein [Bacteroidota bacterium]
MKKELTAQESLGIVSKTILTAKIKNQETGSIFIFWGLLMMLASLGQYLILQTKYTDYNYYPYFAFPLGAIFTWLYYSKKFKIKDQSNVISSIIPIIWMVVGINFMVLSIGFETFLGELLTPVILILLGMATILTGHIMKSRLILIGGMLSNIAGFICFQFAWEYHGLILSAASLICLALPGFIIRFASTNRND